GGNGHSLSHVHARERIGGGRAVGRYDKGKEQIGAVMSSAPSSAERGAADHVRAGTRLRRPPCYSRRNHFGPWQVPAHECSRKGDQHEGTKKSNGSRCR